MADDAQYSSGPESGSKKRKYDEPPTSTRVTSFSAPILSSSSPDAVLTTYNSVVEPTVGFQQAKQHAQEIAARLISTGSGGGGLDTKRPRVDNGGGYDSDLGLLIKLAL